MNERRLFKIKSRRERYEVRDDVQWSNGIDAERHTALLGRGASAP